MITKNGHNFFEMAAMLQNAIRRADYQRAGYAANEMFPKYRGYLWRRLLIISAEDCYGIMTKEIVALKQAEEMMKNGGSDETIFVSKAITLLCYNWHTSKGRAMGRDVVDAIVGDQLNMQPLQLGLWDNEDWERDVVNCLKKHNPKGRPLKGIDWSEYERP